MDPNTDQQWWQIEDLFAQALDLPEDQREAFLDQACDGDLYLKQQVKILLDTQKQAETFLNNPGEWFDEVPMMPGMPAAEKQPTLDGAQIGPYQLLHSIGRGGMGQVYLAKRSDEAFKQYVALKLIRRGMDTEDILRRFRTERQILASLAHENIARLLDGGSTAEGLSYFVMEYVDGMPITDYCDRHQLSIDKRLKLFRQVCSAVQYAHQNLIVHRDLKPSNILVTPDGVSKLLDFGIAKLLNPNLSGYSVAMTRAEQRVMTPEYASPEQVRGETITTASDVYSLGVLLYELLAGHRPYRLQSRLEAEVIRVICQEEPQRPSTAISSVSAVAEGDGTSETLTAETISQARGVSVERLRRWLQGDLDTIVLMALKKEPQRRYASVEQLAEDLRRHAEDLPVVARRDTVGYRARKFAGRHRVGVAMAAVLVVLLAGFAVAMALQQARTARALTQAQVEAAKSARVTEFVVGMFEAADPWQVAGDTLTARSLLEAGASQAEALEGEPLVQAQLLDVIGMVYLGLGRNEAAAPLVEQGLSLRRQAMGSEHEEVARSLQHLAEVRLRQGVYAESDSLYHEALAMQRTLLGSEHLDVAQTLDGLGLLMGHTEEYAVSESFHREALAIRRKLLGEEHVDVAWSMKGLGAAFRRQYKLDEAEPLYREALAMFRKLLGDDHPTVANSMNSLGILMMDRGEYAASESLHREVLAIRRKVFGEVHPEVATSLHNLAWILMEQGRYAEAESLHRESLAMRRQLWDDEHPRVLVSMNALGMVLHGAGNYAEAESIHHEALAIRRKVFGDGHITVANSLNQLGAVVYEQGRYAEAEPYHRESLAIKRKVLGEEHLRVAISLNYLAWTLTKQQRYAEAEPFHREALAMRRRLLEEGHVVIDETQSGLGACLTGQGRYAEAEPLLVEAYTHLEEKRGPKAVQTLSALDHVIDLYEAWDKPDKAAQYRAKRAQQ